MKNKTRKFETKREKSETFLFRENYRYRKKVRTFLNVRPVTEF